MEEAHEGVPKFEDSLADVVFTCWTKTVSLRSDFARLMAAEIAAAASEGFITNKVASGLYVNQWVPTPVGLEFYQDRRGDLIF